MEARCKGKKLRKGYTTGACAAAAAKGAALRLFSGERPDVVGVDLPGGRRASLEVQVLRVEAGAAVCCVVKDAGDDPDVTHGALICAEVKKAKERGRGRRIELRGGRGVGTVTKPGLQVGIGQPAINPVPRKMITRAVMDVLPAGAGAVVTITVPEGEKLAKRTMNGRLGIIGGISILGTTGIVEPMSVEAMKTSLLTQIDVALAAGYEEVVLTPGRIGERRALKQGIPREAVIITSNYVGYILQKCREKGVKKALLLGHMGKLIKLAAGERETHSRRSVSAIKVIAEHGAETGIESRIIGAILECSTTEEALSLLRRHGLVDVLDCIARKAGLKARDMSGGMDVAVAIFSMNGEMVGRYNLEDLRWGRYMS
jgi:cobalt-precorrin-5B (C1)-methyltransferase